MNLEELMKLDPEVVISSIDYTKINDDIARVNNPVMKRDGKEADNLVASYEKIGKFFAQNKKLRNLSIIIMKR